MRCYKPSLDLVARREAQNPDAKKTGIAAVIVALAFVAGPTPAVQSNEVLFRDASGKAQTCPSTAQRNAPGKKHKVTLTWKASPSHVPGYNVYRSTTAKHSYVRINKSLVRELTYVDDSVESGKTYYYVIRSADEQGHEGANSIEISVTVRESDATQLVSNARYLRCYSPCPANLYQRPCRLTGLVHPKTDLWASRIGNHRLAKL